jgi:hypothetical protein
MDSPARILVVGDMHYAERSIEIVRMMEPKILHWIKKYKPDRTVFLGDTLDRFGSTTHIRSKEAITFFYQASLLCPIVVIIGNHDIPNKNDFMTDCHGFTGMKYYWANTTVVDTECYEFELKGLIFQAVPYCPNGRFLEGLNTLEARNLKPSAIFCHQEIANCDLDGMISLTGDEWPDEEPLLICGHIHKRQRLKPNVYYPGSPYQDKVNEYYTCPEDKGISLLTFYPDRTWKEKRIPLHLPVKAKITLTAKKFRKWTPEENYIYYVTIHGTSLENAEHRGSSKVKAVEKMGGKVIFSNIGPSIETEIKKNPKELVLRDLLARSVKDKPHLQSILLDLYE